MSTFTYRKDRQRTISFPVGGLGTGSIGIAGNGNFIDWQVYNRPAFHTRNGYSHFAVKAQDETGLLDARVLVSDLAKPYMGQVDERTMLGLPHFRELVFEGKYPMAELAFQDERFPGRVSVRYYNPRIPLNDKDSSIPVLFADILVENTADHEICYTTAGVITNPNKAELTSNHYMEREGIRGIRFASEAVDSADTTYSDFTLATDAENVCCQEYWFRGNWRDHVETYWREFASGQSLQNRRYGESLKNYKDTGMLCATAVLAPGQKQEFHYCLTWNVPNCSNYWSGLNISTSNIHYDVNDRTPWKNYYAVLFEDSTASAVYSLANRARLYEETGGRARTENAESPAEVTHRRASVFLLCISDSMPASRREGRMASQRRTLIGRAFLPSGLSGRIPSLHRQAPAPGVRVRRGREALARREGQESVRPDACPGCG